MSIENTIVMMQNGLLLLAILPFAILLFVIILNLLNIRKEIYSLRLMYGRHLTSEMWKEAQPAIDAATTEREKLKIMADTLDRVKIDIWERTDTKNMHRDKLEEMADAE